MSRPKALALLLVVLACLGAQAQDCATFPTDFVPFSAIYYVSNPGTGGDRLVVGAVSQETHARISLLPLPASQNQQYCGLVRLAPGLSATAYVPTMPERQGGFSSFIGILLDPWTATGGPFPSGMIPFSGGIIPMSRIASTFAWRISSLGEPEIAANGVVNAASYQEAISSGSWVSIYGQNLALNARAWHTLDFSGNALPASLDGVSVTINGKPAAVYYISPLQINVQAPTDDATGPVPVQVTTPLGTTNTVTANLQVFAPGFFTHSPPSHSYPAAVHLDGRLVGRVDMLGISAPIFPVRGEDLILLFGTGFGPTDPPVPAGEIFVGAAPLVRPEDLEISIGEATAGVQFAGLSGAGLYQFNVVVPDVEPGDQPLVAEIGALSTQPGIFLTVIPDSASVLASGTDTIGGTMSFDFDTGTLGNYDLDGAMDVFWQQHTEVIRSMGPVHGAKIVNLGVVDFDSITFDQLAALEYSTTPINGNDDATNQLVIGDVFAVLTNAGCYAKVKVLKYGYTLEVQWVLYAPPKN